MKEECFYQIKCKFCNNIKISKEPFSYEFKENNKTFRLCTKCQKKIDSQLRICNNKIDKENLPLLPDLSKMKTK